MEHTAPRPLVSRGLLHMLASACCFGTMGMLAKLVGRHVPTMEIVLARLLVTLVLSVWAVHRRGLPWLGHRPRWLFARGFVGFLALSCYFFALSRLALGDATVIQFTNPLLTALLAAWVLRERLDARVGLSVALCTLGIVLVARPPLLFGGGEGLDPLAVAVAITGAVGSAAAYVIIRRIGTSEAPEVVVLSFPLVGLPFCLPLLALGGFVVPSALDAFLLLAIGVLAQVGQVHLTHGLRLEPAGRATSVTYVQIVLAFAYGVLVFDDPLRWTSIVGAILVVVGTSITVVFGRR